MVIEKKEALMSLTNEGELILLAEEKIKNDTKATIRCIPIDNNGERGKCIVTGKDSERMVVFGKAY